MKKTAEKPPKSGGKSTHSSQAGEATASKAAVVSVPTKKPKVPAEKTLTQLSDAQPKKGKQGHTTGTTAAQTSVAAKGKPSSPAKSVQAALATGTADQTASAKDARLAKGEKVLKAAVPEKPAQVPAIAKSTEKSTAKSAAKPAQTAVTPAAGSVNKTVTASPVVVAQPAANVPVSAVAPGPLRRSGRKAAAPPVPVPQPLPSHSPDAAKATFSNIPERVMNLPVHTPARKDPLLANNWKNKPADQLSDQEVLSMPDAEYMNDVQMAFFRHKLVTLKNGILANAGETTEHLREDTVVVPDPADRATIEEEHALELRTRDRERKLLKKIEQSIARIDSGDYGYCDETGEPIGVGRLIARPTASLSLEAQQRRELKQKMFGD